MKQVVLAVMLQVGLLAAVVWQAPRLPAAQGQEARYELWVADQSDGSRGGARLYIYDGNRLEAGQSGSPEVINLEAAATGVGDGPGIRAHMLEFNNALSHALIANVASGHVYVMRARDRRLIASIDVGEQAHHAMASPDDSLILVANQNGKRLARIRADFAAERFAYNRADDLNLGALEDADHPDNAPICPVISGGRAYVTVRGGGLYVVDYRATPMRILKAYGRGEIGPAGCGGMIMGDRIYINSGTAVSSDLYVFNAATDTLTKHLRLTWTGSDSHGMVATGGSLQATAGHAGHAGGGAGRFLWLTNRADGNIVVINTNRDAVVGILTGVGAAPDIMALSPSGRRVFVALRGPNNLTGGPSAKGETPGVAVLEVTDEGRGGRRVGFLSIGEQTPASTTDTHTLAIRPLRP
jgi:DNA-binding beta-propeller fold protein YncE